MMNTEVGGKREAGKRRAQTNQAIRKTRRRRNQTATAMTTAATHSHFRKRKNKPSVMWTCMNSINNAAISKQAFICIKVTRQNVPLLLYLYGKGEFFIVAHQRYAIRKRVGTTTRHNIVLFVFVYFALDQIIMQCNFLLLV